MNFNLHQRWISSTSDRTAYQCLCIRFYAELLPRNLGNYYETQTTSHFGDVFAVVQITVPRGYVAANI